MGGGVRGGCSFFHAGGGKNQLMMAVTGSSLGRKLEMGH
jgi:hypothetical protein